MKSLSDLCILHAEEVGKQTVSSVTCINAAAMLSEAGVQFPDQLSTDVLFRTIGLGSTSVVAICAMLAREVVRLQAQIDAAKVVLE
jgi:hypothetical protein